MSRGLGELQREISKYVGESAEPVTVEFMRWSLYERLGKPRIPEDGALPNEWNTSFSRAVNSLVSRSNPLLQIEKRRLASLEECVMHYPGKTLLAATRRLRTTLLPALLEWTREKLGAAPHYNTAENEQYLVEHLPQDRVRCLRVKWMRLESLMQPSFARSGGDDLLLLFAKGGALFRGIEIRSRHSFAELVRTCCVGGDLPSGVVGELRRFATDFLSPATAGSLKLKSFVHEFAHVPPRGQCSLCESTKEALHRLRKPFVELLAGFRPAENKCLRNPHYSDAMDKLFDQTVFQRFKFVRPAAE